MSDANEQLQRLFKERGAKPLKFARKAVLEEKIRSCKVREALTYFMTECWHDVARPGLLSIVCESVGGRPSATTKVAVPLILISGATDIHDDIIDESDSKYGKPTVYGKFGRDVAILAGDALFFKGLSMLSSGCGAHHGIVGIVKSMFFELGDAEALELDLRRKTQVSPKRYLEIIETKAADVEAHTRIGAIVGGGERTVAEALGRYGRLLGMLIILKDDYIDSLEEEELGHRIQNEHFPMPLLYALNNKEVRTDIGEILRKLNQTRKDAKDLEKLIRKAGGYSKTEELMDDLIQRAEKQITGINKNEYLKLMLDATRI